MAKKTDVSDPLEAAKISAPGGAQAPQGSPRVAGPSNPPPPAKEPDLPPPVALPASAEYRVLNQVTVSWGGQFIRLQPGDVVGERLYGVGAIDKLRQAGVALESVG